MGLLDGTSTTTPRYMQIVFKQPSKPSIDPVRLIKQRGVSEPCVLATLWRHKPVWSDEPPLYKVPSALVDCSNKYFNAEKCLSVFRITLKMWTYFSCFVLKNIYMADQRSAPQFIQTLRELHRCDLMKDQHSSI